MALAAPLAEADLVPALLRRHGAVVATALRRTAPPRHLRIGAMAAYHMGWVDPRGRACDAAGGKHLRGGLALWAAEASGGDAAQALDAAVAVEWVHNFTLVHDDIQDGDRERRHRPALWTLVGASQAINAGDALHALAQQVLTRPGPYPARRLRAAGAMSRAVLEVIEGQCLDLAMEGRAGAGVAAYLRLARAKTGALLGGALEAGALLGGASTERARRLRLAGRDLGAAFQVRDDWLGTWGDPAVTGKPADADLLRRKHTFCVAAAWEAAPPDVRRRLRRLLASPGVDGTAELRCILDDLEAPARTATAARRLADAAVHRLDAASPAHEHRAAFEELAAWAARRDR